VGKTENVISERAYTILEIMSIQGYKMWTIEAHEKESTTNDISLQPLVER
jgi:starvation-inducible outer membrane lipoprotein